MNSVHSQYMYECILIAKIEMIKPMAWITKPPDNHNNRQNYTGS